MAQQIITGGDGTTGQTGEEVKDIINENFTELYAGGGGHVIEDEGTPLTQRADLNFVGAGVTATDAGGKTVITIPGGASISDTVYGSGWNGDTTNGASKNALYDKIETLAQLAANTFTGTQTLRTGGTAAGSAPIKFVSGSLMTAAEVGAIEFLTDKYYGTITTGAARKEFTLNDAALTSGRIPYTTTNGRLTSSTLFTFNGTDLSFLGAGLVSLISQGTNLTSASQATDELHAAGLLTNASTNKSNVLLFNTNDSSSWNAGIAFDGDLLDNSTTYYPATGGNYVFDQKSGSAGLQYAADYSANYTSRSLADWGSIKGAKTFTGRQVFAAPGTAASQFNLPTSAAPSSPADGDVWREDNTNTGLKIRVNGVTKTVTVS